MNTAIILFVVIVLSGATFVTQNVFARSHNTNSQPTTLEGQTTQRAAEPYSQFNKCLADAKTGETEQQCSKIMPIIDRCNNTSTTGPFTDFFNGINDCPVKVLFESPNSVQLQYQDTEGRGEFLVTGLEQLYHWYEISQQDDGFTTTIVLAPLC